MTITIEVDLSDQEHARLYARPMVYATPNEMRKIQEAFDTAKIILLPAGSTAAQQKVYGSVITSETASEALMISTAA